MTKKTTKKPVRKFTILTKELDLSKSDVLYRFETFDPKDWTVVRGTPKWTVSAKSVTGGSPAEPTHGQIFYKTPVKGDVVLEFDAKIVPPSYHDLVWMWNVDFRQKPWGAGYLGCLQGWWGDRAGIEKLPDFLVSAIAPSFKAKPGKTYHIVSGSIGPSHFILVDGVLVTYFADKNYPKGRAGYFGFGVYESMAEYKNLVVYRPNWKQLPEPKYAPGVTRHVHS